MQIQGRVIDVEFDTDVEKNGGGTYVGTTLTYKDSNGKVNTKSWVKKVLDHPANAKVKSVLETLAKGDNFTAEAVKNDAGFWNWNSLSKGDDEVGNNKGQGVQSAGTRQWTGETPEERAERRALDKEKFAFEKEKQKLIIRQSSLSSSVSYCAKFAGDFQPDEIIRVAKQFEAYVLSNE